VKEIAKAQSPTVSIPRVSQSPKLEDFRDGATANGEVEIGDFRQREPGDGTPVSQPTRAFLSYDDKHLYVVFVCKDDPSKVRARMAKREDIAQDDQVAVYLDTYRDRRRAYIFAANPLGIQRDGVRTEGQATDYSFDTLWYSEGRLTSDGFIVSITIPFKSLRFSDEPRQTWGIALGRSILRNNEEAFWPRISLRAEGFVQQLATLDGLERISPGRNLQFIPYGIFTTARFLDTRAAGGPAFRSDTEWRGGLDGKIILRDTLSLDVAVNPDFSQVESDDPQVTINQRFEVRFPEKRPFFLENAGFFVTPEALFFSRRIVDPEFGLRLTGKLGGWTLGALAMDDEAPGKLASVTSRLHDRRAAIGVVRVQREFSKQSTVGVLVTSRDFASSSNRVYALDTRLKLNPNWVLAGQMANSTTRQLDGAHLTGPLYRAELTHTGRHSFYSGRYVDRSPSFRSQLGFINRVDIRFTDHNFSYTFRPKSRRVVSFGPTVYTSLNWDRQGRLQDWVQEVLFGVTLKGQTLIAAGRHEDFVLFQGQEFREHYTVGVFSTQWLKWMRLQVVLNKGARVNFFPPIGRKPFLSNSTDGTFLLTYRPSPKLRVEQTYLYSRLGTRGAPTPGVPASVAVFNNHLSRSKVNYQFTRELSVRAILDYNAVLPNTSLVALQRTKRLTGDVLVTYLVNPWTALYVGYTDNYQNLALDPTSPPRVRLTGSPTTSTGRQFFVKFSYLLRF
jgi:hypothetical protein